MNLVILILRSSLPAHSATRSVAGGRISAVQLLFVLLFIFPFLPPANAETPQSTNPVASKIRALTQAQTRIVWCQDMGDGVHSGAGTVVTQRRLMGFDTEDGRGEHVILSTLSDYARPMLTPRGDRIIFSHRPENKIYIVNWDGSGLRCLGNGYALEVWRDPVSNVEWVYGSTPMPDPRTTTHHTVQRAPIDHPDRLETVWTRTRIDVDNFQLSANGQRVGGVFPWPDCGIAELPNRDWKKYGQGCWPSLAPDNSGLFWIFDGAHRNLTLFQTDTDERWGVNINRAPGIDGYEVYHPRWSNHKRFITMTGPYKLGEGDNRIGAGGPAVELYLGQFDSQFRAIEHWVRVTYNTNADFYPDVWIAPRAARDKPGPAATTPRAAAAGPAAIIPWPGNTAGLIFLWENRSKKNEILEAKEQVTRTCRTKPRGLARYDRYFGMDLAQGVFTTEPVVGERLLAACRTGNQFSIEAVLTPRQTELTKGSRVISFASGETNNIILGQEQDRLILRLNTAGCHAMRPVSLCRLTPGVPQYVIVSYAPGRLQCFLNGKPLHVTNTFSGGLESWRPGNLVFGDRNRFWPGTLDHIALYGRAIQAPEARKKYARIADQLKSRCTLARLVLDARLVEATSIPTPASIRPYRRALVVNRYDHLTVIHGQCAEQQILAAHWAILDGRVLDTARRQKGKEYRLTLESFDAHPELEGERLIMDSEEFLLPLYYEVEW